MGILEQIYECYEMTSGCRPERREAQKRFSEVWQQSENVLGKELGEELRNRIFEYMEDECSIDFQAGFRMGVQLMFDLHLPGDGCNPI